MARYIPVYAHPDRMPVDISFVFENEKPAGKHGFCQIKDDHFCFEDGTKATFFGVICNGGANFPDHDYAEKTARRLAQAGVNYVRFHQLDSEWSCRNLYRMTTGKVVRSTRDFAPESMDALDYWIKCLKENGIYTCIDMTTYRKFKTGDGVKFADQMKDNMKCYAMYDPVMIELQKEFCTKFWNHVNPYTGLAYKDDPFFFACVITNENDTFKDHLNNFDYFGIEYYDNMFRDMFAKWLKDKGVTDYDPYACKLYDYGDQLQQEFRIYLEETFADTMYKHIRSLGVKIPICCTNWTATAANVKAQEKMDFQDGHCYYYKWHWGEYEKRGENDHILGEKGAPLAGVAASRIYGQPQFMTEWDIPWPNCYRAEGPIWYPAMAAFQGFSGMSIHTYAYSPYLNENMLLGKENCSNTIGSVPYREGIFTVWNDPAKFGLFYHGALMLRRGDVSEAKKTVGSRIKPEDYVTGLNKFTTFAKSAMETHKVVSVLDTTDTTGLDEIYDCNETLPRENPNLFVSDTGELWRDAAKRIGAVDTPRTKVIYGELNDINRAAIKPQDNTVSISGMSVKCNTDFGVIAMSSLNDDPIETSDNILLTTVGRACNTDMQFDGEKFIDYGKLPIRMEVIDAEIRIKTTQSTMRVWSVDSNGFYAGRIATEYKDGWLSFHVGPHYPCEYYLLMAE